MAILALQSTLWWSTELQEPDLYVEALGMMHGAMTGLLANSPLHYSPWFSFGYPRLAYAVGAGLDLTDRDTTVRLMNGIGHVSAALVFPLLWSVLRIAYDGRTAWVGALLLVLSPMFLDFGTSAHQNLTAVALFLAGFCCLLARLRSLPARGAAVAGSIALLAFALTVRAEVAFAFPWVVLTGRWDGSWRGWLASALVRTAACVAALAIFFLLRAMLVGGGTTASAESFIGAFYKLSNVPRGLVSPTLGFGIASTLAFLAALVSLGRAASAGSGPERLRLLAALVGPLGLVAFTLLVWITNPLPSRHFLFLCVGAGTVIGIAAREASGWGRPVLVAGALALAVLNQVAAAAVRPLVMRAASADVVAPLSVSPAVPVGFAWTRRHVMGERARAETQFGNCLAQARIPRLVVLGDQSTRLATDVFRGSPPASIAIDEYQTAIRLRMRWPDRAADYIYRTRNQRSDLPGQVLADPAYADFAVVVDPLARLKSDVTPVPPQRAPAVACAASSAE